MRVSYRTPSLWPWQLMRCVLTLATLLLPAVGNTELQAGLSANVIEELDSVQLLIRDLDTRQSQTTELESLEADFHVLGVNTSSQYRFVNGRAESWVDYQITLQPKRTGELIIPSITIGQQRTQPLRLSVRKLTSEMRRKVDQLVFYELELSAQTVYVQSQLLLTRRLIYADGVQLYGGQLETPQISGAQIFELGEGQSSVIQREGRSFGSFEQRYAIFPEQSGELVIPSDNVTVSVRINNGVAVSRKTVRVSTESQRISVLPIPAEYPEDQPWLAARAVDINQRFVPALSDTVNVGDTLQRILQITVIGNTGASVPPTQFDLNPSAFKTYPQPPVIDDNRMGDNLSGQRTQEIDFVPIVGGALRLPGSQVTWWNIDTQEVVVSSVADRALSVSGAAIAAPAPLVQDTPEQTADTPEQLGGTVQSNANALNWWTALLALLVALALRALWQRMRSSTAVRTPAGTHATNDAPARAKGAPTQPELARAIQSAAAANIKKALVLYLAHSDNGIGQKSQEQALGAFCADSEDAQMFVQALNAACYGEQVLLDEHRDQGAKALAHFSTQAKRRKASRAADLPPLYPTRPMA